MLLSIIGIGAGLVGALIGATVALRTKKMDLAAKVDDRRAESLRRGYDLILAATDLTWHYQCHLRLHAAGWDLPRNWKTDWPKMRNRIDAALTTGVDLLKQYSSQYDNVAIVISWAWQVTREGYTLRMMESRPDDYLEVRDNLILCARADSRMSTPIRRRHWKTYFKSNRPQEMADLDASGKLSRVQALMSAGSAEGFFLQDVGGEGDDNVLLRSLTVSGKRRSCLYLVSR
jgi:hypothetical protein